MADTLRQTTIGPEGRAVAALGSVGALVAWSDAEGPMLASGGEDGKVRRWNATTGAPAGKPMAGRTGSVVALAAWSGPEGPMLASGGKGGTIRRWNATTGAPAGDPMTGRTIPVLALVAWSGPEGPMLASASGDGTIRRWNATTGAPAGDPITGHTGSVLALAAWSGPEGPMLASGGEDGTIRRWNAATGAPAGKPMTGHTGSAVALAAWSGPEGPMLASASGDRTIRRWNAATGAPAGDPITGHTGPVVALAAWSGPEGLMLASASWDGTIRRWNAATGAPAGDPITGHVRPRRIRSWQERPAWFRHSFYWALALGAIALTTFDTTTATASNDTNKVWSFAWFMVLVVLVSWVAIKRLVSLYREWELVGVARTVSRSLVVFTCLLGFTAFALVELRRWGLHVEACHTVGELETCQGPASARQILDMLAWHAANAVPVLDITHSLEWPRPARSDNAVVGASILVLRLWVAIGILAVLKNLWDKWWPGGSNRPGSDGAHR